MVMIKLPSGWCPCIEKVDSSYYEDRFVCGVDGGGCTSERFWFKKLWSQCARVSKVDRMIYQGKKFREDIDERFK